MFRVGLISFKSKYLSVGFARDTQLCEHITAIAVICGSCGKTTILLLLLRQRVVNKLRALQRYAKIYNRVFRHEIRET